MLKEFKTTDLVLIIFSLTACAAFILGKLDAGIFQGALMIVLGFFFGVKTGEIVAGLRNRGQQDLG